MAGRAGADHRPVAEVVAELKRTLAPYAPKETSSVPPVPPMVSGHTVLDETLGGGLERGEITELCGPAGRMGLALGLLAGATQAGHLAAVVDPSRALDVRGAVVLGVELERVLWVVPPTAAEALRAADLLLASGCFGLVVVELSGLPPAPRHPHAFLRLQRRAAQGRAALLLLTDAPQAGPAAALTLRAERLPPAWRPAPGQRFLLCGRGARLVVVRRRGGPPGGATVIDLYK